MHLTAISGSSRPNAQSKKVADYLAAAWSARDGATAEVTGLSGNPLPFWDESARNPSSELGARWKPFSERLKKADALAVVAPEWHGMAPAPLKNFFTYWTVHEVGHKPALIVTVSAARGGSYPVDELRISGYKNSRVLYIPEHIIVRDAGNVLNAEEAGPEDAYMRKRIAFALDLLSEYAKALQPLRASGLGVNKEFPNGM